MANTIRVPRAHLILALCLPLAVLIGYFLAEPAEPSALAILGLLFCLLCTPLLLRYHHPFLVMGWNASVSFSFLPGQPALWMVLAFACLGVGIFNRAIDANKGFLAVPSLLKALAFFAAVVCATAALTGGIGFHSFGSSHYGGRFYLELAAGLAGYFALTSERIPAERAGLYVGLFFLSGLTALMSNLIYLAGPSFYFLYSIFPASGALDQAMAASSLLPRMVRLGGLLPASTMLFYWVLARYGVRGTFDFSKPGRFVCLALALVGCLFSGFRAMFILFLLTFFFLFTMEGLWRTRALPILLSGTLAVAAALLPASDNLPLVVQRTLSFLPLKLDPGVRADAQYSTEWRLDMWKMLEPQIPKYLIKGKGYNLDASDLLRAQAANPGGFGSDSESSAMAMEYHSGPLSVLIPFGIGGLLGFLWFIYAALRVLYLNYRHGEAALRQVNAFLLAAFAAKSAFFFAIFGALHAEFFWFTGLVGLSVSLNGGVAQAAAEPAPEEAEAVQAV